MKVAKSPKLAWSIAIALLVMNLVLIGAFWLKSSSKDGRERENGPHSGKEAMVEELKMDEKQAAKFGLMYEKHREKMDRIVGKIRKAKTDLFSSIPGGAANPIELQNALDRIGALHADRDEEAYGHFLEVHQMLQPEQYPKFKELINRIIDGPRPHHPPGRNHPPHRPPHPQ